MKSPYCCAWMSGLSIKFVKKMVVMVVMIAYVSFLTSYHLQLWIEDILWFIYMMVVMLLIPHSYSSNDELVNI
jgi:hypothetical protein